jgi:hypothetical protein
VLAEIFALLGKIACLSLLCFWMLVLVLWWKKLRRYLLDDLFLLCGGIFLVEKDFTCYLLELVRNFLHIVVISSCFMVNLV